MKIYPDIWLYNPTCDFAIGNGKPSWQPNKLLQKMEADMGTLPLFLANPEDFILVDELPSDEYLRSLKLFGIQPPRFITKNEMFSLPELKTSPINRLRPWGWSPAAHQLLSPFKASCSESFRQSPVFNWKQEHRDLYSRKLALSVLNQILEYFSHPDFIPLQATPRVCREKSEFEAALKDWGNIMIKAPWSSSGRGLQAITKSPVHPKVWEKVLGIVKDQGYAMVEPLLDKQLDIAFQFDMQKGNISFLGISNFTTDKKGQYTGNHLNGLPDSLDDELKSFAQKLPELLLDPLITVLKKTELADLFEGNFGVDALIYKDLDGHLKVNPCLEINLRHNMGLLSLHLEKMLVPGVKAIYRTWFDPVKGFADFKTEMEKCFPLKLNGEKMTSGFFALTDARENSRFGAYILATN